MTSITLFSGVAKRQSKALVKNRSIREGWQQLTPRERQTLRHLLSGRTEARAASMMRLSFSTVHVYVKAIYRKFCVRSRAALMALFLKEIAKAI